MENLLTEKIVELYRTGLIFRSWLCCQFD